MLKKNANYFAQAVKKSGKMTLWACLGLAAGVCLAADVPLPKPERTGGKPLMEALDARRSARAFADREPDAQTLSSLLWAADGINRPDGRRTAPTGLNVQDIDLYVMLKAGVYRYDAKTHALAEVAAGDFRAAAGRQKYAQLAPVNLFYVQDTARAMKTDAAEAGRFAGIHAGAIMQNVYLFCAQAGLVTVARASIDPDALAKALKLAATQRIVLAQTVGYPAPANVQEAAKLRAFEQAAVAADARPPVWRAADPRRYSTNRLDYALNNGLAMTRGGRIWASWISGGDGSVSFTAASWSDDGGRTWTDTKLVIDGHDGTDAERTNIIGTFWLDPDGRLRCYTDQSVGHFDGRAGFWEMVCENPDDANPVWSPARRLGDGHVMNKPIVLRDGTWAMAAYLNDTWRGGGSRLSAFPQLDGARGATCYVSADRGRTWERRGTVKFPAEDQKAGKVQDWQESQLVELKDGSLRLFARVVDGSVGCLMAADSKDGGRTFGAARRLPSMDNTNARFQIQRLKSGRLVFVKHGVPDAFSKAWHGRRQLTAYLSDDDGQTWKGGLVLDWGCGSYPDLFQAPDGSVFVSHDHGRGSTAEIWLHRFTEEDVLAHRIVSAQGRLGMIAMRAMHSAYNRKHAQKGE